MPLPHMYTPALVEIWSENLEEENILFLYFLLVLEKLEFVLETDSE